MGFYCCDMVWYRATKGTSSNSVAFPVGLFLVVQCCCVFFLIMVLRFDFVTDSFSYVMVCSPLSRWLEVHAARAGMCKLNAHLSTSFRCQEVSGGGLFEQKVLILHLGRRQTIICTNAITW